MPLMAITDAVLVASSVPEAPAAEYAPGATYAAGDLRGVTAGTEQVIYQSLQGNNAGHPPASSPTWWKKMWTVYAAYVAGTAYAKGALVTGAGHVLYESQVDANNAALTDTTRWLVRGSTNRWAMFDRAVSSQTFAQDSISVTLVPPTVATTVVVLNATGFTVTVTQPASGYSRTKALVRHDVNNWFDWWYSTPSYVNDLAFDDVPPFPGYPLTITVDGPGQQVGLGCCFIGKPYLLGKTQWEFSAGVLSYSTPTTDKWGNTTLNKSPGAKRQNYEVSIAPGYEDEVYRILTLNTDVELVVIAATDFAMGMTYGYLGQWQVYKTIAGKPASIEVKGLT